jgi:hypothetical protein
LDNIHRQAQLSSHDHCGQEINETNILNDKIKKLEAIDCQKSKDILELNRKISE